MRSASFRRYQAPVHRHKHGHTACALTARLTPSRAWTCRAIAPGASGLLRRLGVETHDAQGQLRDTSTLLTALGERLKRKPYDRAYAYAQALGIDEKTLNALQQGVGRFSAMYRDMLRASGLDAQAAAKSSHAFMNELRLLGATAGIVRDQVAASLTGAMSAD